jgi:hypothetical protein
MTDVTIIPRHAREPLRGRAAGLSAAAALMAALVAVFFWYHARQALDAAQMQIISSGLQPIATLLKENQALTEDLLSEKFKENDFGIFESYLAKIRRDGVPKHADMKQRLDALAENNTAIVTLIKAYAPYAKTSAFTSEADKFRTFTSASRDRWNSVLELFMAGGNYAASEVPSPHAFPDAVQTEIISRLHGR